jgi:hypothetical protein
LALTVGAGVSLAIDGSVVTGTSGGGCTSCPVTPIAG